jgi:N-acylneuraminate cytidylyltransferase
MIHNRKVTALVPIKEHSERINNKNFRSFNGKPLYHHILETLQNTYAIDEIVINTDSYIVINEAPKLFNKVSLIERPQELRGDFVSVNKIIAYDLTKTDSEIYIQTHATNPLLKAETLALALKKFIESEDNFDSLFSVNRFQSRFYNENIEAVNHNPNELIRTQDLAPLFEENSNFYIFTKDSFNKKMRRIGANPIIFEMSRIEAIDIDDDFSFKLAEILSLYAGEHLVS